jgi:hypothetical protein
MTASSEPAPAADSARRLPEFFIVGHHKSGTTALYEMLRRHPQIYMPDIKEPRWFDSDLHEAFGRDTAGKLPQTFEAYLDLFADATPDQRLGEASPSYLRSSAAAAAIAAVQPTARCVAILREPASFVRSLHLQMVQDHVEQERDLRAALAAEQRERGGRTVHRYTDHLHYMEQLGRYRDAFAPEQLLVLIYDDFRADNEGTVRRVLRFLDVDDRVSVHVMEANPTVGMRSLPVDRAFGRFSAGRGPVTRAVKGAARTVIPQRARTGALRALRRGVVYSSPPPPDEALMAELRRRFRPEVEALGDYLQRDLIALWGYDRAGD